MTQLVIRTRSGSHDSGAAAYAVCVAHGRAFAHAMRPEWQATAQRVERALNAGRPWERHGRNASGAEPPPG